ncbi:MAG: RsmB/NOP family class I SAM-dependent RNA methyltransferase [Oscillospiraceae bacterium]|nr:RsmB/NOP family class I SAM-dependent RNA methyltransferase [Oscillospiraceae bacterium]
MIEQVPSFVLEKLRAQYPSEEYERILHGYQTVRRTAFRVNTIKSDSSNVLEVLQKESVPLEPLIWFQNGFLTSPSMEPSLQATAFYEGGSIYLQNPSSMVPPVLLDPQPGEDILDMCAAPGSKTTELFALSSGKANLTACEKDRIRSERLRFNLKRQGASRVNVITQDARKLDPFFRFNKVLLDAPCSGSGTISALLPKTYRSISEQLVSNSSKLQLSLLRKAMQIIPTGGEIVYSTCSLFREENEHVVRSAMKQEHFEVVEHPELASQLPLLTSEIHGALLICPNEIYEGFFAVHLRKLPV